MWLDCEKLYSHSYEGSGLSTPSAEDIFIKQGIEQKHRFGKSFLKQRSLTSFLVSKSKKGLNMTKPNKHFLHHHLHRMSTEIRNFCCGFEVFHLESKGSLNFDDEQLNW